MHKFCFLVRFTKLNRAKFLSHRELMTLIERVVRRSGIPIAYSEGYNPRPRISFPSALGLGIESEDEVIFLHLSEWMKPDEVIRRLTPQLLDGIKLIQLEPLVAKKMPLVAGVTYQITLKKTNHDEPQTVPALPTPQAIKEVLARSEIVVERSKNREQSMQGVSSRNIMDNKTVDIRPYLGEIRLDNNDIIVTTKVTSRGTIRPEEILTALKINGSAAPDSFVIRKIATILTEK